MKAKKTPKSKELVMSKDPVDWEWMPQERFDKATQPERWINATPMIKQACIQTKTPNKLT